MVSVSVRASLINWLAISLGIHNIQIVILLKSHLLLVMIYIGGLRNIFKYISLLANNNSLQEFVQYYLYHFFLSQQTTIF